MDFRFEHPQKSMFSIQRPLVLVSACLLLGLSSCNRFGPRTKDVIDAAVSIQNLSTGEKLLTNDVSNVRLTLPQGWTDVREKLRPSADLYATNEDGTKYVLVLADQKRTEERGDIAGFDLNDNSAQYLSHLNWGLSQEQPEKVTNLTILNGLKAKQYEVRGRIDNVPVVYLHTTIEGDEHYYQVVAWTSAENYDSVKGELQSIIGSFQGT